MNRVLSIGILLLFSNISISQDLRIPVQINKPDKQHKLVGKFGKALGTTFTVQGIIVEGDLKGDEGGFNIVVQMVDNKPTQLFKQIPVSPYFGEFGKKPLPELIEGATYTLRVYETGAFVGTPSDAYEEAAITLQTTNFYFQNRLVVLSGKKTKPIEWNPIDFLEKDALLIGMAKNENDTAIIQTTKWKLFLTDSKKWANDEIGKLAEVFGEIRATNTKETYSVKNCRARLVNLEDQIGKTVKLRGVAQSLNGYWWFNYRGQNIYVENMSGLPNWKVENHFRAMEITGILNQAKLPKIDPIGLNEKPDIKLNFIIRKASWIPIQELMMPEMEMP
jgi:hypothetical protein